MLMEVNNNSEVLSSSTYKWVSEHTGKEAKFTEAPVPFFPREVSQKAVFLRFARNDVPLLFDFLLFL